MKFFGRPIPAGFVLPLVVFLASLSLCSILVIGSVQNRTNLAHATMEQVMLEKSLEVNEEISQLIYKTEALAALVVENNGDVRNFERVAATLVDDDAILNVLIAPGGVVSDAYPSEGADNLIGFDFFSDSAGNVEAQTAIDEKELVFSGPFLGIQNRYILSGRLPVWLAQEDGTEKFWGIVAVTLKYPEVLENAGLNSLEREDLAYEIWRVNPDDGQRQVIAQSDYAYQEDATYIERELNVFHSTWYFRILPVRQWYQYPDTWVLVFASFLVSILVAFVAANNMRLRQMKKRLQQQEALSRKAALQAQEASHMKSAFLATMSHEIRTPVNGIVGFLDLAAEDAKNPRLVRGYIGKIKGITEGLLRIIDDILDISKIEAGKMVLEQVSFSMSEVFDTCRVITAPRAQGKGLDLSFYMDPALDTPVVGDPIRLQQVLLNLLSNAVKFTDVGRVGLWCRVVQHSEERVSLSFEVSDTGIGMTSEQLTQVMNPFIQADRHTALQYGGTGLGLPISKNLIQLMGGQLEVKSMAGTGSNFFFELSFETALENAAPVLPSERPAFYGDVLVCEDVGYNREVITEQLQRTGLRVYTAENGREAVELVRTRLQSDRPFDLIFMDIYMPVLDGPQAAEEMKALGNKTPIVAMTANALLSERKKHRQAGMEDDLTKPFTTRELWQCLARHLDPAKADAVDAAPAPPKPNSAAIHREQGLRLVEDDEKRYDRLLTRFAHENAGFYEKIEREVRDENWKHAHRLAHSLKGMAAMIGAKDLADAAHRAEKNLREECVTQEELASVRDELARALDEINQNGGAE